MGILLSNLMLKPRLLFIFPYSNDASFQILLPPPMAKRGAKTTSIGRCCRRHTVKREEEAGGRRMSSGRVDGTTMEFELRKLRNCDCVIEKKRERRS